MVCIPSRTQVLIAPLLIVESSLPLQLSLAKQAIFLKVTLFLRGYPQQITGQYEVTKIVSLTQGLLSLKGRTSLELIVALAESYTADSFFYCRENCSATLSLFFFFFFFHSRFIYFFFFSFLKKITCSPS